MEHHVVFKAFLSHRYKSTEVNLFFHEMFRELASVQFEIDLGSLPTNVTRLERMIRSSDAFVGIYSFDGGGEETPSPAELLKSSRYFRLETELAIRSGKPALIFYDARYASCFSFPPNIYTEAFDAADVTSQGRSPMWNRFKRVFKLFSDEVMAYMSLKQVQNRSYVDQRVGIFTSQDKGDDSGFSRRDITTIKKELVKHGIEDKDVTDFLWPPVLSNDYIRAIEECDWIISDIGETALATNLVGYFHGRAIPTIRVQKGSRAASTRVPLYLGSEVGYPKDIIYWNTTKELKSELSDRLTVLLSPTKRISTETEAENYFRSAALRKETVFLSYSGKDLETASQISKELKQRFQNVFDYRDGESITPGEPWLEEIFDELSVSKIGIQLVSTAYLKSGNCKHEAHEMVAKQDSNESTFFQSSCIRTIHSIFQAGLQTDNICESTITMT